MSDKAHSDALPEGVDDDHGVVIFAIFERNDSPLAVHVVRPSADEAPPVLMSHVGEQQSRSVAPAQRVANSWPTIMLLLDTHGT